MKKIFKKLTAVWLALSILLSTGSFSAFAKSDAEVPSGEVIFDESDIGYNTGRDHLTTAQFFNTVDNINAMFKNVFGFYLFNTNRIKVEVNGVVEDIFNEWTRRSNGTLDIMKIANGLPDFTEGSEKISELLRIDVNTLAPIFKEKANEFYSQGKTVRGILLDIIRIYLLRIDHMTIDTELDSKNPSIYHLFAVICYKNGTSEKIATDYVYDNNTHELKRLEEKGIFGFNLDADGYTIYAVKNTWQRYFGFCITYDILANLTIYNYDTKRIYLTYGGKDWLFQIWKGIYWIANGAEIGIYNRPEQDIKTSVYGCAPDEDMMFMSLDLYQGNRLIFSREPRLHWWIVSFTVEEKVYEAQYLTAKGTIQFPDEDFAEVFVKAARGKGLEANRVGTTVSWLWAQGC